MPALSIAIPTCNRPQWVAELVARLLVQLAPNDELVVVDDSGSNGTETDLTRLDRVRHVRHQTRQGMVRTWNECLRSAKREWICTIHDDDTINDDALETLRAACAVAGGPALIGHVGGGNPRGRFRVVVRDPGPEAVIDCDWSPSGATLHRDVIAAVGLYDEALPFSPDLEYFPRICRSFRSVAICEPQVVSHRLHEHNYMYRTWVQPEFLDQLEAIVRTVTAYAGLAGREAERFHERRLLRHLRYILDSPPARVGQTLRLRAVRRISRMRHIGRRRRVAAAAAAVILAVFGRRGR